MYHDVKNKDIDLSVKGISSVMVKIKIKSYLVSGIAS